MFLSLMGSTPLSKQERKTLGFWFFVALLIVYKCIDDPSGRTVVNNYLEAAHRWVAGENIYFGGKGFLYLPQFAFLFSFIESLPRWMSEAGSRLIQLSIMVYGLLSFSRFMNTRKPEISLFPLLSVTTFLISFSSFRNGQTNIAILGFMLLTVVALAGKKWNRAAVFMTMGIIFKPTFIVFYLLAGALHRPMYIRLVIGMLVATAVPMLFTSPGYVLEQHINFVVMLEEAVQIGVHKATWASFFGIFPQLTGYFVPETIQMAVRLVLAPVTLYFAWYAKKRNSPEMAGYYIYALAACYLMLFNPRNENNDYAVLSVAIGFWVAVSVHFYKDQVLSYFSTALLVGIVAGWEVSIRITPEAGAWLTPVIATILTAFLLRRLFFINEEDVYCQVNSEPDRMASLAFSP